jgi:hypothetical protein
LTRTNSAWLLPVFMFSSILNPARGDTLYTFAECSGQPPASTPWGPPCYGYTGSWSFLVPAILTETTTILASQLFDVTPSFNIRGFESITIINPQRDLADCNWLPPGPPGSPPVCTGVKFTFFDKSAWIWNMTPAAPFDHFGTYSWSENGAQLTITETHEVPESSVDGALLLVTVCVFACMYRRL